MYFPTIQKLKQVLLGFSTAQATTVFFGDNHKAGAVNKKTGRVRKYDSTDSEKLAVVSCLLYRDNFYNADLRKDELLYAFELARCNYKTGKGVVVSQNSILECPVTVSNTTEAIAYLVEKINSKQVESFQLNDVNSNGEPVGNSQLVQLGNGNLIMEFSHASTNPQGCITTLQVDSVEQLLTFKTVNSTLVDSLVESELNANGLFSTKTKGRVKF